MKRLKFINCDKKISIKEIESLENKYNFKYPEEIKKHYLKCNGGYPNKELYEYDGEEYKINYFLSIGNKVNSFELACFEYLTPLCLTMKIHSAVCLRWHILQHRHGLLNRIERII